VTAGDPLAWLEGGSAPARPPAVPGAGRAGTVRRALDTLDPGYFAFVMASGIVSVGADLLGYPLLSQVVLGVTVAGFVLLTLAYGARLVWFRASVRRSLLDPTTAMAYFTVVAGSNVLAARVALGGHPLVALGLGAAGALVWLGLTYGLPWSIVVAARRPVLGELNGTWLVWVVATQSVAIVAAALAPGGPPAALRAALPAVAVCFWGVGAVLYLLLIGAIFLRLLLVEITPAEMGPAYWIAMGATAISVRAAAGILADAHVPGGAFVGELRPFLVGLSTVLWAFGTWWIPLLVLFGVWRYLLQGYPRTYEPRLWSVVFPLGMYTVASYTLGRAARLGFMVSLARAWFFVGLSAWAVVLVLMLAAGARALARRDGTARRRR
jgi:tellurite resistance protein TehA-like permease